MEDVETSATTRKNFDRLDPSRRSFSSPSVEIQAKTSSKAHRKAQSRPPLEPPKASNVWRRRTALGLIPLGPALNWFAGGQQQQQQQARRKFSSLVRHKTQSQASEATGESSSPLLLLILLFSLSTRLPNLIFLFSSLRNSLLFFPLL